MDRDPEDIAEPQDDHRVDGVERHRRDERPDLFLPREKAEEDEGTRPLRGRR
jgi:hypothetical protein